MPAFASALGLLLATQALAAADPTEESRVERSPRAAHRARGREARRGALDAHAVRDTRSPRSVSTRSSSRATDPVVRGRAAASATTGCSSSRSSRASSSTRSESRSRSSRRPSLRWDRDLLPETPRRRRRLVRRARGDVDLRGRPLRQRRRPRRRPPRLRGRSPLVVGRRARRRAARLGGRTRRAFGASLASAASSAADRSDRTSPRPPTKRTVLRVIGDALLGLPPRTTASSCSRCYEDDRSDRAAPGDGRRARAARTKPTRGSSGSDARALGAFDLGVDRDPRLLARRRRGCAATSGPVEFERVPTARLAPVEERVEPTTSRAGRSTSGLLGIAAAPLEPRVTLALRDRLGRRRRRRARDHAYRQSGLQANETGFGGVRALPPLRPAARSRSSRTSRVATAGAGISLFALELARPRLPLLPPGPARRLAARARTSRPSFDGRHRDVGHELDLVLAIEEGDRFELELSGSLFRAGSAFGARRGEWAFGGLAALRVALARRWVSSHSTVAAHATRGLARLAEVEDVASARHDEQTAPACPARAAVRPCARTPRAARSCRDRRGRAGRAR